MKLELRFFASLREVLGVSWGDGLVDCPPGEAIKAGDMVKYIPFSALLS